MIAWYLGDDTSYNTTPSELFDRYDAVKAADPTRLTTQADVVGARQEISNYQDYVAGSDNFLPELYPVRGKTPDSDRDCVAKVILDMKRCRSDIENANAGVKSIWPIIQYFEGWGWKRFPTCQELRAMSFAALIHGAHGITWYTYGGEVNAEKNMFNYGVTTTPERWDNMTTIARQIRDLAPALLERTPQDQPAVTVSEGPTTDAFGNPSVTCLLKEHEGNIYLLCVNACPVPVQASFTPIPAAEGRVLYEDRNISLDTNTLTDHFEGHEVHVYQLTK
ncbi:MAG: hypothetical protein Q4G68_14685 [Planctomycetia bacterium]|nr:hypothetical protein [Planctomycetia bacterium]